MCGRQRCTLGPDSVFRAARVHTRRWNDQQSYRPSYNVAPGSYTPVVRMVNGGEGGGGSGTGGGKERAVQSMKWGLVPSFTKKSEKPDHYRMFNARSESVLEKASFRRLIPRNRCLALAEGSFFEWKKDGSKRQPYYIHLANGEPFVFAALYDRWEDEQGNSMYSYTILTTRVCKRLEWLHDRMPVLLRDEEAARAWLEGDLSAEDIGRLSQPYEQPDLVKEVPLIT